MYSNSALLETDLRVFDTRFPDHSVDVALKHVVSRLTTKFLSYYSNRVSPDGQHCLPCRCSYLHLNATLDNSMMCFHSNLSQRVSPQSELELCALSVPGLLDALEPSAVGH